MKSSKFVVLILWLLLQGESSLASGKGNSSCLAFVNSTGIHTIRLPGIDPFEVPCNSSVSGSGWTVIQRRLRDGNEKFNRNWIDHKRGYGDLRGNFFLGLEKIHQMIQNQPHELYIQLGMVNGSTSYARYDDFKIGTEKEGYTLKSLGKYSGTAGDTLTKKHLKKKFSTDTDGKISSFNGRYYEDGKTSGINWGSWNKYDWAEDLTFSQMMIRPKAL